MFFNFLYFIAIAIASPWLLYRSWKTNRYRQGWSEKWLGRVPYSKPVLPDAHKSSAPTLWLHAVSVGEVQVLRTLIESTLAEFPNSQIVISTTTISGMELAKKLYPNFSTFYMPLDFTWAVHEAFSRVKPQWLLLAELEVWPNLISHAKSNGCKVAIINGRLSEKSFRGYRRLRFILKHSFAKLDFVAVQDATYADRFKVMGVPQEVVHITGSLKFDGANADRMHPEILKRRQEFRINPDDIIWVAGSTQAPEESYILETFEKLRTKKGLEHLRLILVPRHPERGNEIAEQINEEKFKLIHRSKTVDSSKNTVSDKLSGSAKGDLQDEWDILLADTIGELRWWWGLATIAFVGGSFGSRGGQNMIEPVAYGVATTVGPNTVNFKDVMRIFLDARAIDVLSDPADLESWATEKLNNPQLRKELGERGISIATQHRGATSRTVALLRKYID